MTGFGRSIIKAGALRAALALVLVALFALQPGLAASLSAPRADAGLLVAHVSAGHAGNHCATVAVAAEADGAASADHCRSDAADRSCEVHCAPAHAIPVEGARLALPARARFAPDDRALTLHGMTHEFSQPPRA